MAGSSHVSRSAPGATAFEEPRLLQFLGRHRTVVQGLIDAVAWVFALVFATLLRYDFDLLGQQYDGLRTFVPLGLIIAAVAGLGCGLYTGRSRFGSFEEVISLVKATVLTAMALAVINMIPDRRLAPASVPVIGGVVALVLTAGVRYCWRLAIERTPAPERRGLPPAARLRGRRGGVAGHRGPAPRPRAAPTCRWA